MTFNVYIPARYASTRLPGKPLLAVAGKSILEHVYDNAIASGASDVVVATDDDRIAGAARAFGASVAMTASSHPSGTDRIAEAVAARREPDDAIVVNVQGDEPMLPPRVIRQVADVLAADPATSIATVCERFTADAAIDDPNVVKVVRDATDRALYFSRAAIPHARDGRDAGALASYRRHVGIYAYRAGYLRDFVALGPAPLEVIERLEQLRALARGDVIRVADAVADCGVGVDTPADFDRLCAQWR